MELYERVQKVKKIARSYARIAEAMGITQSCFYYYCDVKTQDNFWPLLPKLLEKFPQISRYWLYFGEGKMLVSENQQELPLREALEKQGALLENLIEAHRQLEFELLKQKTI